MEILYNDAVQVGRVAFDPRRKVPVAFWTHRPARRPPAGRILTSEGLARRWSGTIGLPMGHTGVAMGLRLELLPSGYGASGVAVMVTRDGLRTLVVGPTSEALTPRRAERLVMAVPAPLSPEAPTLDELVPWLQRHLRPEHGLRLRVPDGATAERVSHALALAGVAHGAPRWLGLRGRPDQLRVVMDGPGLVADVRPQASTSWLAGFVAQVAPEQIYLHGPGAPTLGRLLHEEGWAVRVLAPPTQLPLVRPRGQARPSSED